MIVIWHIYGKLNSPIKEVSSEHVWYKFYKSNSNHANDRNRVQDSENVEYERDI